MSGLRVIAFGAHPDDCEYRFGGAAAKFGRAGAAVKFVSMTNGDAGHQEMDGGALAKVRYAEAQTAGKRLGIAEYQVMDNHDGALLPTLELRRQTIRAIRQWNADLVLAPRPSDYHPDHRYTAMLVQDAAFLVVVPKIVPDVAPLRRNPIFLYFEDDFQDPAPFRPDVAVDIDDVWDTKVDGLDAHASQFYDWLPWLEGNADQVPSDAAARRRWLSRTRAGKISPAVRAALERRYGTERGGKTEHAEAFQLCEFGRRASVVELCGLLPE
jgi:LmbE family N-acetylglucosaminyl deacetylase